MRLILPLFLLAAAVFAAEEDWNRFRGPNGSGVSASTGIPTEFGPSKNIVWRTEIPFGRSSPILTKERIFVTATDKDKLLTLALDRSTGKIQWRRELPRERANKIYKGNDSATPTPSSDGVNVYAFFPDFGLVSYGPDGNERWRMPLGPFESFYGLSASPVLHGDTLYQVCDQNSGSFVVAVDLKTGKLRWKRDRPHARIEAYSTPAIYTPESGKPQLIVSASFRIDAYDLATGDVLWFSGKQGSYPISTPAIVNGIVYATAAGSDEPEFPPFEKILEQADKDKDGKITPAELATVNGMGDHFGWFDANQDGIITKEEWEARRMGSVGDHGLIAVRAGGSGDQTEKHFLWRYKKAPNMASPLIYNGVLYIVKDGGIMTSLNPESGEVFKAGRLKDAIGPVFASPVAADGKVYFTSEGGKINVVRAGEQWETIAVNDLAEECYATPAIAGGRIYVRTRSALYSFGTK